MKEKSPVKRCVQLTVVALVLLLSAPVPSYAATKKAAANRTAHAAYYQKLEVLKGQGLFLDSGKVAFVDLTNDGVDEMAVNWFPSIYTYRKGKVVRISRLLSGSSHYMKYWPKKKVIRVSSPDHAGGTEYVYYKWKGKKFVKVASTYTPKKSGRAMGFTSYHWVRGKGRVSKATCSAYIKKLTRHAKKRSIKYNQ